MKIAISPGELIDRLTIFELKIQRGGKSARLLETFEGLRATFQDLHLPPKANEALRCLRRCNRMLWRLEDRIRAHERDRDFGQRFILSARLIARLNDKRARLRGVIDSAMGAEDVHAKTYEGP